MNSRLLILPLAARLVISFKRRIGCSAGVVLMACLPVCVNSRERRLLHMTHSELQLRYLASGCVLGEGLRCRIKFAVSPLCVWIARHMFDTGTAAQAFGIVLL